MPIVNKDRNRADGSQPNSLMALLPTLPPEIQKKYRVNRAIFEGDRIAMETWAAGGFTALFEQDERE